MIVCRLVMLLDQPMETCHQCGAEADGEMDGKAWCASCLHIEGSCCADDESEAGQSGADE